jgi:hypothetical protein
MAGAVDVEVSGVDVDAGWNDLVDRRRCVAGSVNALTRHLGSGQTAWATSVNAAATRRAGGASTASS